MVKLQQLPFMLEVKGPMWIVKKRAQAGENHCGSAERMSTFTGSVPDLSAFTMIKPAEESKTWCCHTQTYTGVSDVLMFSHCLHTLRKDEVK